MLNFKDFLKITKNIIKKEFFWDEVSQSFYKIIKSYIKKDDKILEFGSASGHISYRLAKEGHIVTLLDIRKNEIKVAQNIFKKNNVRATFICRDIFNEFGNYDIAWDSGLIQCLPDEQKEKLIEKISSISKKMILFYPDIRDPHKIRGTNQNSIPGVGNALEYDIEKIPEITKKYFHHISTGKLEAVEIKMNYGMYWIYASNEL